MYKSEMDVLQMDGFSAFGLFFYFNSSYFIFIEHYNIADRRRLI